ncbi:hypothetical protein PInf_018286 [Phytophthora infestans]|nr:hypothetical protein PInf_018286 [Phytophthora infestans]
MASVLAKDKREMDAHDTEKADASGESDPVKMIGVSDMFPQLSRQCHGLRLEEGLAILDDCLRQFSERRKKSVKPDRPRSPSSTASSLV